MPVTPMASPALAMAMICSRVSKLPWIRKWWRPLASSTAISMKRRYSSSDVPHSETSRAPQKPSSMLRRTSCRMAASFRRCKSELKLGIMTLHTPRQCAAAHSFASARGYCTRSTSGLNRNSENYRRDRLKAKYCLTKFGVSTAAWVGNNWPLLTIVNGGDGFGDYEEDQV